MKFFIINSFRFLVYIAYFGIIALYAFGAYIERAQIQEIISKLTGSGTITAAGTLDPGMVLAPSGLAALAIVAGLIMGWIAATLVCGVLVTLLDIRDDINDRLPRAK
ncbi:MAG TPA: hypothetical protein PLN33_06695 [Hyphomonadaceae bacterium]|nr:hypothetical protein [Hyphomonadaceae bacterium]HPN05168.1 hypothetical protein [Hyphomonadaceae bacterium]